MNQLLRQVATFTADASGMAEVDFTAVPNMLTYTGLVHVGKAPATAQHCAEIGPHELGCFWGTTALGPIQLQQGEFLHVESRGLIAGETYFVFLNGQSTDADLPFVIAQPAAVPPATTAQFVANDAHAAGSGSGVLVPAPGAGLSVVIYTIQMASADSVGSLDAGVTAGGGVGSIFTYMGAHLDPAGLDFGGLILPANADVEWTIIANPDPVNIRFRVTYSILPTS